MERAERFGQCPDLVVAQDPVRGRRVREGEERERRGRDGRRANTSMHRHTSAHTQGRRRRHFMYAHVP